MARKNRKQMNSNDKTRKYRRNQTKRLDVSSTWESKVLKRLK